MTSRRLTQIARALIGLFFSCQLTWAQTNASSGDTRPPVDRYRAATQVGLAQCKVSQALSRMRDQAGQPQDQESDYTTCMVQLKRHTATALPQVLKTVKKIRLRQALEAYHKVYSDALIAVAPLPDETPDAYDQRQLDWVTRINTAWENVESQR